MELIHPELTQQALHLLRNGEHFEWHVIPMLAFVMYICYSEVAAKNRRGMVVCHDTAPPFMAGHGRDAKAFLRSIAPAMLPAPSAQLNPGVFEFVHQTPCHPGHQ